MWSAYIKGLLFGVDIRAADIRIWDRGRSSSEAQTLLEPLHGRGKSSCNQRLNMPGMGRLRASCLCQNSEQEVHEEISCCKALWVSLRWLIWEVVPGLKTPFLGVKLL